MSDKRQRRELEPELVMMPEWLWRWFHRRSKPVQAAIALPVAAWLLWLWWGTKTVPPRPGEPAKAIWVTLLALAASVVLSELLRPKPAIEDARPAGLGDFQIPTATEGRPVPIVWGSVRMSGPNVVWTGDLRQEAITETVKTGLWSKETFVTGFRYHLGLQMGLCRGGGDGVELTKVTIGEREAFAGTVTGESRFDINKPDLLGGEDYGAGGIQSTVDFYPGSSSQTVNAYLDDATRQRITTAATPTAPAYNGTSYVVARQLTSAAPSSSDRGAYLGNSTSIEAWAFDLRRFPSVFTGQAAGNNKIGSEANPANCAYELLTNTEWGFGYAAAKVDVGTGSTFNLAEATLRAEGNGMSIIFDRFIGADKLKKEIERQINGAIYFDRASAKWKIELLRDATDSSWGYNVDTIPQATDDTVLKVDSFTRGTWEDTTNTIQVRFNKRTDNYKESYALAQDMGAAITLADGDTLRPIATIGVVSYPGVKTAALASQLAWRDLRAQSYPLARANLTVDRTFWNVHLGQVIAFTNSQLGFTKLPMRIVRIEEGATDRSPIRLQLVQDVFRFAAASMGDPPDTRWTPPTVGLVAFPSDEQVAFEAPRGIVVRDPEFGGDISAAKVWCGARRQGSEVAFRMTQRNASGTPSGSYADAGTAVSFLKIGDLNSALDAGTAIPTATVTINSTPDSQTELEAAFDDTSTIQDLGADLAQVIMIGDGAEAEFCLVQKAANGAGSDVDLQNVYRGVLGTSQRNHAANTPVYLLHLGGALMETAFDNSYNVDVELRMRSASTVFAGAVTKIAIALDRRALRPYPPSSARYNGTAADFGTPNLEGDGSGLNGVGFDVDWLRSAFDASDEVAELSTDNAGVDSSTEYRVTVFVDPSGANVQAFQSSWVTGSGPETPTQVAIANEAAIGTEIRVQIEVRHDLLGEVDLPGHHALIHDVTPTSSRSGHFYLGGDLSAGTGSNAYTAAATGTFTVNIGAAFSSQIQYRINGGTWTNLAGYTAGSSTSGTIPGVVSSDTIELRHQTNTTPSQNFVELVNPSAVAVAYGVFTDGT